MSYTEKEKLIKSDILSIENRVRHVFNQGYDLGYKDGLQKSETVTEFADRCRECGAKYGKIRAEIDDWAYGLDLINISKEEKEITRKTLKKVLNIIDKHTKAEREDKVDSESTASRFKCRTEQGGWCKRWERECVSWENCELSSYNFPCPGCIMSSPLEREECDSCKWKDEKQKQYRT